MRSINNGKGEWPVQQGGVLRFYHWLCLDMLVYVMINRMTPAIVFFEISLAVCALPFLPHHSALGVHLVLSSKRYCENEMSSPGGIFSESLRVVQVELRTFYSSISQGSWERQEQTGRVVCRGAGYWTKLPRVCTWPRGPCVGSLDLGSQWSKWDSDRKLVKGCLHDVPQHLLISMKFSRKCLAPVEFFYRNR